MVAMAILSFVMLGLYQFTMDTSRILYSGMNKIDLDSSMRKFSLRFQTDMETADAFYLYTSFLSNDRADNNGADRLEVGGSGDYLLFVYTQPYPYTSSTVYVSKLVGYFCKYPTSGNTEWGTVYRFEKEYQLDSSTIPDEGTVTVPSASAVTVESIVNTLFSYEGTYTSVMTSAKGLFSNRCFYMLTTTSVKVGVELYRGSVAGNSTELMNLTISLR